jgi:hypothetical protein
MSYPDSAVPEAPYAAQTSWATPDVPSAPVVGAIAATHEVAGVSAIASPPEVPSAQADTVADTVAGAVANAQARYASHMADTIAGVGTDIGQQLNLPPSLNDPAVGTLGRPDWRVDAGDEPVPG